MTEHRHHKLFEKARTANVCVWCGSPDHWKKNCYHMKRGEPKTYHEQPLHTAHLLAHDPRSASQHLTRDGLTWVPPNARDFFVEEIKKFASVRDWWTAQLKARQRKHLHCKPRRFENDAPKDGRDRAWVMGWHSALVIAATSKLVPTIQEWVKFATGYDLDVRGMIMHILRHTRHVYGDDGSMAFSTFCALVATYICEAYWTHTPGSTYAPHFDTKNLQPHGCADRYPRRDGFWTCRYPLPTQTKDLPDAQDVIELLRCACDESPRYQVAVDSEGFVTHIRCIQGRSTGTVVQWG